MRRYVVVRTDKVRVSFVLREFEQGRLRQGWGWLPSQDLRLLRAKVNAGQKLSAEEIAAWHNRRLLDTEPDGLKPGDVVVVPNLPERGRWVLARVTGPYTYAPPDPEAGVGADYAHVVAVAPIRAPGGSLAVIDPDNENVDARLRATMRNLSRMWSIDALGAAVEKIIAVAEGGGDMVTVQPEAKKQEAVFEVVRAAAWTAVRERYHGAQFEQLVLTLFRRVYAGGRVEHWGGRSEQGADLIVFTQDPLGLEYKVAVQAKMFDGVIDDTQALVQIAQARKAHRVDAGVVVTTATETSERFEARRAALEEELGIDIKVIDRDELTVLLMEHLGRDRAL